jgi:hypothetical protein
LKKVHGDSVSTDVVVNHYIYSETRVGKIDIVYTGKAGAEIYDLKTVFEPFYRFLKNFMDILQGLSSEKLILLPGKKHILKKL